MFDAAMDDSEQDGINQDFIQFAINESIQDAHKQLYSTQIDRKESNSEEFTKIMAAIQDGDELTVEVMSCCFSAFRESDSRGWRLLHAAAVQPKAQILLEILQGMLPCTDLNLEVQTQDEDTALTLAAGAGLLANVKLLLQYGASPHNTNGRNESPLLIAVRQKKYEVVVALAVAGAYVGQVCLSKWTAIHEAAKVGCPSIMLALLRHGAQVGARDGHGVTPLGIAAAHGNAEALEILIQLGGDVNAQASNGDTIMFDAAGNGNVDCIKLLVAQGANPNIASYACQLPIHRAAYEGHILALRVLIPITTRKAIILSGQSPVHSAVDGGQVECLELLLRKKYNVNALLGTQISENYGDLRRSPLYFAVSNGDMICAERLLAAGARTDLDPLQCILVAVRAERHDLVRLLLSYGAEVNCYFSVICNTQFPTALQYSLRDLEMLRLLLNSGYQAHKCFDCCHGNCEGLDSTWAELHNQVHQIYSKPEAVSFCDFVSVTWFTHLVGGVVRILLDYVSHVSICFKLKRILETSSEWEEISEILSKPRSLQHTCRLLIRGHMSLSTLNSPKMMAKVPFPPRLKRYLTYADYHMHGKPSST